MKQRLSSYLLLLFFIPQLGGCANSYPIAKVTLHVVNQDGKPISDTKIEASFWMGRENLSAYPDKEGFVSFQSPVLGDAAFSNEQTYHPIHKPNGKDKYYTTMIRKDFGNRSANVIDGKWQPWNPIIEFVLKDRVCIKRKEEPYPYVCCGAIQRSYIAQAKHLDRTRYEERRLGFALWERRTCRY